MSTVYQVVQIVDGVPDVHHSGKDKEAALIAYARQRRIANKLHKERGIRVSITLTKNTLVRYSKYEIQLRKK